jgi:RND superfamily putative drug exporter
MKAYVGGSTAAYDDLASKISSKLPLQILVVIALSFLLLILAFRTVVVPPQAAVMNLLSIGASYGVLTAIFQYGWLHSVIRCLLVPALMVLLGNHICTSRAGWTGSYRA